MGIKKNRQGMARGHREWSKTVLEAKVHNELCAWEEEEEAGNLTNI